VSDLVERKKSVSVFFVVGVWVVPLVAWLRCWIRLAVLVLT